MQASGSRQKLDRVSGCSVLRVDCTAIYLQTAWVCQLKDEPSVWTVLHVDCMVT